MAPIPVWSGNLRLSLVLVPVRLFPATSSEGTISFRMIHKPSGKPIKYLKGVETDRGFEEVSEEEIIKGYEHTKGHHVLIKSGEMDELKLEAKHTIDMVRFVDLDQIDSRYFEKPYYLLPDGDEAPMFAIPFVWLLIGFAGMVVFGSFFEWTLHRFVLHRALWFFRYPFDAHAIVHHRIFRADHTHHVQNRTDEAKIPMTRWNGPPLILVGCIPFVAIAAFTSWWLLPGAFVAACAYYATYEYLHWCMHKPRRRLVERSGIFFLLNGHHLLHHRYMHKNFNVVLPLADLCLNTLLVRSKICFAQARGEGVPDVQPKDMLLAG